MTYHVERFRPSFRHETNNWGPTITRAEMLSSSAGDYVRYSDYEALRARLETVEAETREHLRGKNELVLKAYPAMDAIEAIQAWCDAQKYENDLITVVKLRDMLPTIRNLEPRHD